MSPFLSLSLSPLFVKLYSISVHLIGTCAHHHHGRSSIAFIEEPSPSLLPCLIHHHYHCRHKNFIKLSFIPISHIRISLFSIFSRIFRTHQNCIFVTSSSVPYSLSGKKNLLLILPVIRVSYGVNNSLFLSLSPCPVQT